MTFLTIIILLQDVFKRRAEIELNYSRDLEKLSKLLTSRHKEQKLKVGIILIRLTVMKLMSSGDEM